MLFPIAAPRFLSPMLATLGDGAFDSDENLFELRWDGIRALTFIEGGSDRILTRHGTDLTPHDPMLGLLTDPNGGYVLDGELVVLRDGTAPGAGPQ